MLSAESIWITPPPPAREVRFGNKSTGAAAPPTESRLQMNFKSYGNNYPSNGQNAGRNGPFGGGNGGFNNSHGAEDSERARQAHAALSHPYGDFHTYLHVYNTWESQNRSLQWCERNFVNFRSMKTVASIRYVYAKKQFLEICSCFFFVYLQNVHHWWYGPISFSCNYVASCATYFLYVLYYLLF